MTPDIPSLRRQLQKLQEQHASGALDDARYEESRLRLERQLVDRVMAEGAAAAPAPAAASGNLPATPPARPSTRLVALSSVFVLLVAVAGYAWHGAPALSGLVEPPQVAATGADGAADGEGGSQPEHQITPEQVAALVEKLRLRLESEPDNAEGWLMLARSYSVLGRPQEAAPAYKKAIALNPQNAGLLADYADTLAMVNNRQLAGEPLKLIERALALDPDQPKALSLAGTAAFDRKDYATAAGYWRRMQARLPPDSPFAQQVQASIDEASRLGNLPATAQTAPLGQATAQAATAPAALPGGGAISGTVNLSPALAGQVKPDDTVFIFARAAEGPRMPLAIVRKQVKDLPISFKLDDGMAMTPQMKLSAFAQVVVGARISKSGNATAQPGDLQGLSSPVAVGRDGLVIEINQAVGP